MGWEILLFLFFPIRFSYFLSKKRVAMGTKNGRDLHIFFVCVPSRLDLLFFPVVGANKKRDNRPMNIKRNKKKKLNKGEG